MTKEKKDYNKNYIVYRAKCHKVNDADIIEYMEGFKNKQQELKRIIRNERSIKDAVERIIKNNG